VFKPSEERFQNGILPFLAGAAENKEALFALKLAKLDLPFERQKTMGTAKNGFKRDA